jgi:hypothetical protein
LWRFATGWLFDEIEEETSMGEWHRTTVLFTGLHNMEKAFDYIADRDGFVKVDFDPRIVSPTTSNRLLYSEPRTATTWLLALQPKSDGVTIMKSFPLGEFLYRCRRRGQLPDHRHHAR